MKYPIWEKLSPQARRAAASAKYVQGTGGGFARTAEGCCPLGVAFQHDGVPMTYSWGPERRWDYPGALEVARALHDDGLRDPAARFINDWDGGKIRPRELAALLEVDR